MSRVRAPSIAHFFSVDLVTAFFLGLIQGVTEFLPVSSSGHLTLAELLMGLKLDEEMLLFNVFSHLGTLFVIFFVFRQEIFQLFQRKSPMRTALIIGTIPLFFFVPLFKVIKASFGAPQVLGLSFAFTGCILLLGDRLKMSVASKWRPIIVGMAQTVALFPGVSRSGMTISAGRVAGFSNQEAIQFSFLLAIPAVLGSLTLEIYHLFRDEMTYMVDPLPLSVAIITSFIVGFFSLGLLKALGRMGKLGYFAWYCLALSGLTFYLL